MNRPAAQPLDTTVLPANPYYQTAGRRGRRPLHQNALPHSYIAGAGLVPARRHEETQHVPGVSPGRAVYF